MQDFYSSVKERFADWNYGHPVVLYGLIRAMKPEVVVEVGAYRGFGACWMARALQENDKPAKLYCIDNFTLQEHVERYGDPKEHFLGNLEACGVRDWVELIEGDSGLVEWPAKVDFCYVDGWHSYDQCRMDTMKAVERGAKVIGIDDTENCVGPRMWTEELRRDIDLSEWDVVDIHSDNGLFLMFRRERKRLITFSQELPYPNPGVDLRPLTFAQQEEHFAEASRLNGLNYLPVINSTESKKETIE